MKFKKLKIDENHIYRDYNIINNDSKTKLFFKLIEELEFWDYMPLSVEQNMYI